MSLITSQHLTPETEWLEHDIGSMFQGDQTGVGLKYLYQDWHRVLGDGSYYVDREDRKLIAKNKAGMSSMIGEGRPLIELGCGGSDKGVILAESFKASQYVGVDFWFDNAQASANLSKTIPSKPLQIDFMRSAYNWGQYENAILVVLGSTISNLVACSNLISAEEVYNTEDHIAFRKGIFKIANNEIPNTYLDDGNFDVPAVWDENNRFLSHNIVANKTHSTLIAGHRKLINLGQSFIEGKSYKFSKRIFDDTVTNVGATTMLADQAKHMVIQHIRR